MKSKPLVVLSTVLSLFALRFHAPIDVEEKPAHTIAGSWTVKGRSTWLKVNRQGKNITVSISHDEKDWSDVKTFPVELADELHVGVAALNTSDTPFTVDFEDLTIKGN